MFPLTLHAPCRPFVAAFVLLTADVGVGRNKSRLAAKIVATSPSEDGRKRAEDKSKATVEAMYKECTFAPNTVGTKALTEKILAAKGKQVHPSRASRLLSPASQ